MLTHIIISTLLTGSPQVQALDVPRTKSAEVARMFGQSEIRQKAAGRDDQTNAEIAAELEAMLNQVDPRLVKIHAGNLRKVNLLPGHTSASAFCDDLITYFKSRSLNQNLKKSILLHIAPDFAIDLVRANAIGDPSTLVSLVELAGTGSRWQSAKIALLGNSPMHVDSVYQQLRQSKDAPLPRSMVKGLKVDERVSREKQEFCVIAAALRLEGLGDPNYGRAFSVITRLSAQPGFLRMKSSWLRSEGDWKAILQMANIKPKFVDAVSLELFRQDLEWARSIKLNSERLNKKASSL